MNRTNRYLLSDRLSVMIGTGLGIGFAPIAPGTFGSLLGPLMVWGMQQLELSAAIVITVALLSVAAGVPICAAASRALGKHDPGQVVYDEIAAFWLVFLPHLIQEREIGWPTAIVGFLFFRVFDIAKPWPLKRLEKLPGGLGIMADDLAAGVYAAVCLFLTEQIVARLF